MSNLSPEVFKHCGYSRQVYADGKVFCRRCGQWKDEKDFYPCFRKSKGFQGYCKSCANIKVKEYWQRRRVRVLEHYGGKPLHCECCGETALEFLSLDHINGRGNEQRRTLPQGGQKIYQWILKMNFPPGFRVLCYNCNFSLGHYGHCPHQTIRLDLEGCRQEEAEI